jgi:hypothetical protein
MQSYVDSEEHIQRAHALMLQAYIDCAVCIVDAVEFFEKFVSGVFAAVAGFRRRRDGNVFKI